MQVEPAAIFTLRVFRLELVRHAAGPSRAPVDQSCNLPAEVLLHPPLVYFHVVHSAWQRTSQTLCWAAWNGGSGSTELLAHGVCVCVLFMDTPFPDHSLTHLVVSPPTRGQNRNPQIQKRALVVYIHEA